MLNDLSIVLPVWGEYKKYLPQLFLKIADEGVPPKNIIVIGNNEISLKVPDNAQLVLTKQQYSIGSVRNIALTLVRTPYVMFLDADDYPVPGALKKMVDALQENPRAVLASGRCVYPDGRKYPWPQERVFRQKTTTMRFMFYQWAYNNCSMTTGTVLRTKSVRRAGGFPDTSLAEDGVLASVMVTLGEFIMLKEATRVYNVHENGLCQRETEAKAWREAYAFQRRYLRKHPLIASWSWFIPCYYPAHTIYSYLLAYRIRQARKLA